jgi:hypothetical protein
MNRCSNPSSHARNVTFRLLRPLYYVGSGSGLPDKNDETIFALLQKALRCGITIE